MLNWLRSLDRVLRGEATSVAALKSNELDVPIWGLCVLIDALGLLYGLCMGVFDLTAGGHDAWKQTVSCMLKVPALFLLTLLVTTPSLYVFNAMVGSRLQFRAMIRLLVAALAVMMQQNRSYIFFRDTTAIAGDPNTGPVGALSVPVTPRVTLAADPAFVPLGAPVFLTTDRPDVGGLWVTQDTGGAIKGANRFDSFWGAGADARRIAGGMSAHGHALVLLPRGVLSRITGR